MTEKYWDVLLEDSKWIESQLLADRRREIEIANNELGITAKKFLNKKELGKVRYANSHLPEM